MTKNDMQKGKVEVVDRPAAPPTGPMERIHPRAVFIPRTDIYERGDALVLVADMPGVDENTVQINLERNVLSLYGRVAPAPVEGHRLSYAEYETGDYERSFTLSNEVDVNRIEATVRQGVLRLVLPKTASARPRQIAVKAG